MKKSEHRAGMIEKMSHFFGGNSFLKRNFHVKCLIAAAVVILSAFRVAAGTIFLDWKTDKEPVSYRVNEPIVFNIQAMEDGKPAAGKTLKWRRTGDDGQTADGQGGNDRPITIKTAMNRPGFVRIEVEVCQSDGAAVKGADGKALKFEGGAGVAPKLLKSYPEPADFDAFWEKQKARLAAVPVKAELVAAPSANSRFDVFDVKVDCPGGKPVSGYLSIPKGAKTKTLAARVSFMGYGVDSACPEYRDGELCFAINAHGIENGREPAYYQALRVGALDFYAFNNKENAKPETSRFNGMMLRAMRAMEFVESRPEWNGRTLIVSGGSQGGFQALNAAALDRHVTKCEVGKPWCCDLGGVKLNRIRGWRPDWENGLAYYDPVNQARRIRCETDIYAGLGDYVCPPSGLSVLYNNLKTVKSITYAQGSMHGYDLPNPQTQTFR